MHTLEQAVEKLLAAVQPAECEIVPITAAHDRILARDIESPGALPSFDNSAMDGWAVRSADVAKTPVSLEIAAHIPAGQNAGRELQSGQCARIFTGSPVPPGADAVVMQEDARQEGGRVVILDPVRPWENIRFRGEDVKPGARIGAEGERLHPQSLALLSACGVAQLQVRKRLRVAILATGSELREPGVQLKGGEIYESNRLMVAAALGSLHIDSQILPIVPDDLAATVAALREAAAYDAIITCGGVSVGEYDFVKAAVAELQGRIDFWRVAIKPGKPFVFANVLDKMLFGLPGNPVSAFVTLFLLVRPALLRMSGLRDTAAQFAFAELAEEFRNPGDRRHFIRVHLDGGGTVHSTGPQASHRLATLAAANALLDLGPGEVFERGRRARVILLS